MEYVAPRSLPPPPLRGYSPLASRYILCDYLSKARTGQDWSGKSSVQSLICSPSLCRGRPGTVELGSRLRCKNPTPRSYCFRAKGPRVQYDLSKDSPEPGARDGCHSPMAIAVPPIPDQQVPGTQVLVPCNRTHSRAHTAQ